MFKRNLLSLLVFGAFTASAVPEGGGAEKHESSVKIPEKVDSWLALGKKEGTKVKNAMEKGEALAADTLLSYGEHLAGEEGAGDWLTGYASAWTNAATGKVRKSEAKTVFDALAMGDQTREIVMGVDPETKEIVKESNTIHDWLFSHNDVKGFEGYAGLIRMAKQLRGASTAQGAGGGAQRGVKLTDKQMKDFVERLPAANANQAMQLAEKATAQLTKLPQFEPALFREISMICNAIKVKSNDANYLNVASQIMDICNSVLDRQAVNQTAAGTSTSAPQAPKPAEAPKAEVETAKATGTHG